MCVCEGVCVGRVRSGGCFQMHVSLLHAPSLPCMSLLVPLSTSDSLGPELGVAVVEATLSDVLTRRRRSDLLRLRGVFECVGGENCERE